MKWVAGIALVAIVGTLAAASAALASREARSFVPTQLRGSWTKTVTAAQVRRAGANTQLVGKWRMTVKASGQVTFVGRRWISGDLAASPGGFARLKLGCDTSNVYTWVRKGSRLMIREGRDVKCPDRVVLFAGVWVKVA